METIHTTGATVEGAVVSTLEVPPLRSASVSTPAPAPDPRLRTPVDLTVATTTLVLLAPVLAVIAAAIKLDSPGPALFRQRRAGRRSAPFVIYKFRTMTTDAEADQALLRMRMRNERAGRCSSWRATHA